MTVVVRVDNVSRSVAVNGGHVTLLAPTTIELRAGSLVAIAGPSGSGKTTLCNIIIGWEPTDSGGVDWFDPAAEAWAFLAVTPQRLALFDTLTLAENIALPFWASKQPVPAESLDRVGSRLQISELLDRRPHEVSFGEQQRAAIARAVVGSPAVAVLDEPTGHQDEVRAALVIEQLLATRSDGTCVVVATHDPHVIEAADEVVLLRQ